jgi:ferredoxin-NADP reductase
MLARAFVFYSVRTLDDFAFGEELARLLAARGGQLELRLILSLTRAEPAQLPAAAGSDRLAFHAGRLSAECLAASGLVQGDIDRLYVCGPAGFARHARLLLGSVAAERVHTESFDF